MIGAVVGFSLSLAANYAIDYYWDRRYQHSLNFVIAGLAGALVWTF